MNINIRYGIETASRYVADGTTVGQVIADPSVKTELGYGDNVRALMDGVEVPTSTVPSENATIVVEVRANQKAELVTA